jgi:porin
MTIIRTHGRYKANLNRRNASKAIRSSNTTDDMIIWLFHRAAVLMTIVCLLAPADAADALAGEQEAAAAPTERTHLLGDWGGARSGLAKHGIIVDAQLTQFYQGVVDGSSGTDDGQYGVKGDLFLTLIGEQLGLWKGLNASIHVESRAGDDVNAITGLSPANVNMVMPAFGEDTTDITQFIVTQMVGDQAMLTAGKFNSLDLFDMAFHTGRGIDRFMNTSAGLPFGASGTVPPSFMGAGAIKLKGKEVQGAVLAYDPNNSATTSGFDPLFDDVALVGVWKFFHDSRHGEQPGYISIGGTWSDKQYTVVDSESLGFIPGQGLGFTNEQDSWSIFSVVHHQLWADSSNPNRDLRFHGLFSLTDGEANPIEWSAAVSLEMTGPFRRRSKDVVGVGYFHNELSDGFKGVVGPLLSVAATLKNRTLTRINIEDTDGFEAYYKVQVTPWLAVTADLQVITETP